MAFKCLVLFPLAGIFWPVGLFFLHSLFRITEEIDDLKKDVGSKALISLWAVPCIASMILSFIYLISFWEWFLIFIIALLGGILKDAYLFVGKETLKIDRDIKAQKGDISETSS